MTAKILHNFILLPYYSNYSDKVIKQKAKDFNQMLQNRRSVRNFNDKPVARAAYYPHIKPKL